MSPSKRLFCAAILMWLGGGLQAANVIPTDIEQPGTQPGELTDPLAPVADCVACHSGYELIIKAEPWYHWQGSMMSHAGRDPLFWATMAVAEQDFDGSGDLCLRCHAPKGWLEERSTPTDGSALLSSNQNGVECGFCHRLTNPDDSEHLGVQNPPFLANDSGDPGSVPGDIKGYYGTGMASLTATRQILGPYAGVAELKGPHGGTNQSRFHRSVDFCGTCHDVSNPLVGDLAHNNGAQPGADPVVADGTAGSAVDGKAAFNNFPFTYGIVERTFSEYKASQLSQTLVSDYLQLPSELQAGSIANARTAALPAGQNGNYADGTARYFSCQSCHMSPVEGKGAGFPGAPPTRTDLPLHDLTGGNYWVPEAIEYLDGLGKLRLGGGLSARQVSATQAGAQRAKGQLESAARLRVTGNVLKVINLTGHKLISGYPEGRRMWLNMKWYDAQETLLREDGAYGPLTNGGNPVTVLDPADGATQVQVRSLQDLHDPNTRIYEAHYGITREWAQQLHDLGVDDGLVIQYDRLTGKPVLTLGQLRSQPAGSEAQSFHFVLNNSVVKDNRISPWGMEHEDSRKRNILPVPVNQYDGNPNEPFRYFDVVALNPPAGAVRAEIQLLYQPTSWEYIQFLHLANQGTVDFLKDEGKNLLQAWLHTGMAEPHLMASADWVPADCSGDGVNADITNWVFVDTRTCSASSTITAPGVLVDKGAQLTLAAPAVTLGKEFSVEEGAVLMVRPVK